MKTLDDYLEKMTWEGIDKRYRLVDAEVKERARFELDVIKKMGYPGYFLIVQDFIAAARKQGVTVGPDAVRQQVRSLRMLLALRMSIRSNIIFSSSAS